MLLGRTSELQRLDDMYTGDKSSFSILYGRSNIGKTTLLKEFCKDKECIYYSAPQASEKEQIEIFKKNISRQLGMKPNDELISSKNTYRELLSLIDHMSSSVKLLIIEEFPNIVKSNKEFISAIAAIVKGEVIDSKIMIICTSSSISWIENSLVSSIGTHAYSISSFLKLKELSFVDTVRMFPAYSVPDCLRLYAITGGVPGYMSKFSDSVTLKVNICNQIIKMGSYLSDEGSEYIKEELRETGLYNTILYCIANGKYKLNELHEHTSFGRDKISVYLKNLIEREIVEKIFSYDTQGNEHTRKGLYRIKAGLVEFWFRYIYANISELNMCEPEAFYDAYIKDTLDEFASDTFIKVGTEFIELMDSMGKLQIKTSRRGRWWGKNGNIDIIACDTNNRYVIGKCNWLSEVFTFEMFEELMYNVSLADIGKDYIYLFSKGTFDEELSKFAEENDIVTLIGINDL